MKYYSHTILALLILVGSGCQLLTRSPAEKSTDPKVIAAVALAGEVAARAKDTTKLVWIGSIAIIAGIAFRFASNQFLPKSTGIGIGTAAGGAVCIGIARFDPALQRVALPLASIIGALLCLYVAYRIYNHIRQKNKEKI